VPGRSWAWSVMRPPKMIRRLMHSLLICQGESLKAFASQDVVAGSWVE
jgi:hypothetical protein